MRIVCEVGRCKYDITLKQRITCIGGDSGTGKTHLLEILQFIYQQKKKVVQLIKTKEEFEIFKKSRLLGINYDLVLLDKFDLWSTEDDRGFIGADTLSYVICTRMIYAMGVSVADIYLIKKNGKVVSLERKYEDWREHIS